MQLWQGTAWAGVLALALAGQPARADTAGDGLSLSGNLRLRGEAIDGQARAGVNSSDALFETRLQLRAQWQHDWLRLVAELHDSRAWGANPGTPLSTGEVNALEPAQAYVQADLGDWLGRGTSTSVQAGRFGLELGSRRLLAMDDYRNTITAYTGLRADVSTSGGIRATALYVLPLLRLPDDGPSLRRNAAELDRESFDTVLWGGFLARQRKGSALLAEASFLHLGERDAPGRPTRDRSLNSLGLRVLRDPRPAAFDWGLEGIYQWGGISASLAPTAARQAVSATFLRLHAGYSFPGAWKPHVLFEFDRASGDGRGPTYGRFDFLYGMRRADLGPAGLYNAVGRSNVISPGIRVEVTPSQRVDGFIGYRALWLADRFDAFSTTGVRDPSGNSGDFAGRQLDSRVRYWLVPGRLRFEADAVLLGKGGSLRHAPNAGPGRTTRYGSLNLTASF
ncbi:MAG TPA: alginate export family protein [Burkholderiaceae bacterium]|nr:alginate export family protein [Burkholderiaceae bacterium]